MKMKTHIDVGRWVIVLYVAFLGACGGGGGGGSPAPPGTIQLLATSHDAAEGSVVNVLVARSGGSAGAASVDFATADETAVAGADYTAASGTLTWADGTSGNQTISIPVTDDDAAEFMETFSVALSNVSVATLGANSSATVSIIDGDGVAQLPITPANAVDITADVLEGIAAPLDLLDIVNIVDLPFPDLPAGGLTVALADSQFGKLHNGQDVGKAVFAQEDLIVATMDCDSGTATSTWDDADGNVEISTGDTIEVNFASCLFSDLAVTLAGDASITNIEITGDAANGVPPWSVSSTFGFIGLQGTDDTETVVIDGGFDLSFSTDDGVTIAGSISGSSLSATTDGATETLGNFDITEEIDLNTQTVIAGGSGALTNMDLDGTVDFEALTSFMIIADDNPSAGQLFITDGSSSVVVTVVDNLSIQLEVDEDGDGTAETTFVVAWDDLDIE